MRLTKKNNIRGELPTFCRFRGRHLAKKKGLLFFKGGGGGLIRPCTLCSKHFSEENTDAVKTKYVSFLQIIVKKNWYSFQDFQIDKVGLD